LLVAFPPSHFQWKTKARGASGRRAQARAHVSSTSACVRDGDGDRVNSLRAPPVHRAASNVARRAASPYRVALFPNEGSALNEAHCTRTRGCLSACACKLMKTHILNCWCLTKDSRPATHTYTASSPPTIIYLGPAGTRAAAQLRADPIGQPPTSPHPGCGAARLRINRARLSALLCQWSPKRVGSHTQPGWTQRGQCRPVSRARAADARRAHLARPYATPGPAGTGA
jgi:hypothetical protein